MLFSLKFAVEFSNGETMRTAASSFPNPIAGTLDGADRLPAPQVLASLKEGLFPL